jgi:hypothetical protein
MESGDADIDGAVMKIHNIIPKLDVGYHKLEVVVDRQ